MLLFCAFFRLSFKDSLTIGAANLVILDVVVVHIVARNLSVAVIHQKLLFVCMLADNLRFVIAVRAALYSL